MNARDCRRVGHGRTHHITAQKEFTTAKTMTTTFGVVNAGSAAGNNAATVMIEIRPMPAPIITRIAPAIDRLAKYCTYAE